MNVRLYSKVKDLELKGRAASVDQLCCDPKQPDLVATASRDKSFRLWEENKSQQLLKRC